MDSQGTSHEHVLWSLNNFVVTFEKVASLECLEPKEIVVEVSRIVQLGIDLINVLLDHSLELWVDHTGISTLFVDHRIELLNHFEVIILSLLMKIGNLNS